jgi:hypothetical protein
MKIQLTPRYLFGFFCLAAIMGISHELAHHVAGFIICGDWGYKTFNSFMLCEGCEEKHPDTYWLATLAGPVLFNYIPMWIGFFKMRSGTTGGKLFGVTLVFSTIPIMRIVFSLMGANDEPYMVRLLFGNSTVAFWLMNIAIWLLTIPPLWLAWKTITNQPKIWIYLFYLLGLPIFVFLFVGIFLENLIVKYHVLSDTLWGMPYLILLAEVLAYWGYYTHRRYVGKAVWQK